MGWVLAGHGLPAKRQALADLGHLHHPANNNKERDDGHGTRSGNRCKCLPFITYTFFDACVKQCWRMGGCYFDEGYFKIKIQHPMGFGL